jgi:hypothetical protein
MGRNRAVLDLRIHHKRLFTVKRSETAMEKLEIGTRAARKAAPAVMDTTGAV